MEEGDQFYDGNIVIMSVKMFYCMLHCLYYFTALFIGYITAFYKIVLMKTKNELNNFAILGGKDRAKEDTGRKENAEKV